MSLHSPRLDTAAGINSTFEAWRTDANIETSIPGLVLDLTQRFNFEADVQLALRAAAEMASEPLKHAYHNNHHLLEVFALSYVIGKHAMNEGRITERQFGLLMAAALIHDYKHDGKSNFAGPNARQSRLEQQSFDLAKDRFVEAGLSADDLALMNTMILATDVSHSDYDFANGPAGLLKRYSTGEDVILPPQFNALAKNSQHMGLALILADADLAASSALSIEMSEDNGKRVVDEANANGATQVFKPIGSTDGEPSQVFFLKNIHMLRFFSQSGMALFQESMNANLRRYGLTPVI